jgi:hypothetical protein
MSHLTYITLKFERTTYSAVFCCSIFVVGLEFAHSMCFAAIPKNIGA